jgi:hypothetical protein
MARSFQHSLTSSDIDALLQNPIVTKNMPHSDSQVDFSINVSKETASRWNMLPTVPLRWIRGDSAPHVDHSWDRMPFDTTHLVYLTDSDGVFYVGDDEYPISAGQGYSFDEGLVHGTRNTTCDRLLMGPFNERQTRVGRPPGIYYFGSSNMQDLIYRQEIDSGDLLSVSQINTINANPSDPRHVNSFASMAIAIPPGRRHVGWVFYGPGSYGIVTIDGVAPVNGISYPVNAAYSSTDWASIEVYPLFGRRTQSRRLGTGSWPPGRHGRRTISFMISS